jgi:hypothetical protein
VQQYSEIFLNRSPNTFVVYQRVSVSDPVPDTAHFVQKNLRIVASKFRALGQYIAGCLTHSLEAHHDGVLHHFIIQIVVFGQVCHEADGAVGRCPHFFQISGKTVGSQTGFALERNVFRWNQLWLRDFETRPSKDAKNALLMRLSGFAKELAQKHPPE